MTIKAILWKHDVLADGTMNVRIYTYPPKRYYRTGIKVLPSQWDAKRGRVKNHPRAEVLNNKIQVEINEHTDRLLTGRVGGQSVLAFLELFISEIEKGLHDISNVSTIKNYQSTEKRLKQYTFTSGRDDLFFADVSANWYADFCRWLVDHGNCGPAGVTKHTKIIKKIMRVALERKLHNNTEYQHFKSRRSTSAKIYLSTQEIALLECCPYGDFEHLARERDRFLVSYYLLMRFGDSLLIRRENAYQDAGQWFYRYISEKTGVPVVVPIKPAALAILERRGWNFNHDTNQEANRHIKQAAAAAGINTMTTEGTRSGPKWQFVTTHTARRSAATNMALAGVQIDTIAKLGGWDRISTLKTYLRASGVDIAKAAARLDFFK